MGNKLCKKRVDSVDGRKPKSFNRIMNKFSIKQKWKSDSNLEDKQNKTSKPKIENQESVPPLSKSSDWTEVELEVPSTQINNNHNTIIENNKPIPPPRKKKEHEIKPHAILQAYTTSDTPIEEPICVKKTINTMCPCCQGRPDVHEQNQINKKVTNANAAPTTNNKGRKTPSMSSLPNYTEFKLSIADSHDDKYSSIQSFPDDSKTHSNKSSNDKLDSYLTRARSFGSLLPTMLLHKMSTAKAPLAEIESDDSSLALDDWGLNMIEHYKPRDASLPRPRKPVKTDEELYNSIKDQLVQEPKEEVQVKKRANDVKNAHEQLNEEIKSQQNGEQFVPKKVLNDFLNAERANVR